MHNTLCGFKHSETCACMYDDVVNSFSCFKKLRWSKTLVLKSVLSVIVAISNGKTFQSLLVVGKYLNL